MFKNLESLFNLASLKTLSDRGEGVLFISESINDWPHIGPIIKNLIKSKAIKICYLTFDKKDFNERKRIPELEVFFIKNGPVLEFALKNLNFKVIVTTLLDLGNFHLKINPRSHIVYTWHSLNSNHAAFRKNAFKNYQTFLCPTSYHFKELQEEENIYHLSKREVIPTGYPRLDSLYSLALEAHNEFSSKETLEVLLAPSWGETSILEKCPDQLIDSIDSLNVNLTIRPHHMTVWKNPTLINRLLKKYGHNPRIKFELNTVSDQSIVRADLLISDWSGVALEFALATLRPVLFVNTKQKILNVDFEKFSSPLVEKETREVIGRTIEVSQLSHAAQYIEEMIQSKDYFIQQIQNLRDNLIYNIGKSAQRSAEAISKIYQSKSEAV